MKFKKPIEVQAGISDGDPTNPLGVAGYLLSSDGSNVSWVSPGGLSAETAEAVVQPIKANEALTKGDPLYIVGYQTGQDVNIVGKADSNVPSKMPAVGIADDDYSNQAFGTMTAFGSFNGNFDTTGGTENWSIGDIIFVKSGGGLTNVKPGGTKLIQNIAIVSRVQQNTGELEVIALGRTNDVPNLPTGRLFVGTAANTSKTSDVVYVDDTNDRVGIRTTGTPSTNLEISPSSNLNGIDISQSTNASQSGALFFTTSDTDEGFMFRNSNGTLGINYGAIPDSSSGDNKINIKGSTGNVGIGTTSFSDKLTIGNVSDSGAAAIRVRNGSNSQLFLETNSGGQSLIGMGQPQYAAGNSACKLTYADLTDTLSIDTSYSTRIVVNGSGNVGIGTTLPTERLEVEDSGSVGANKDVLSITNKLAATPSVDTTVGMNFNLQQGASSAITYGAIRVGEHSGTGAIQGSMRFMVQEYSGGFNLDEKMRIESDGNVGIGTTSPDVKLEVESTASASGIRIKNTNSGFASLDIESNRGTGSNLGGLRYRKTGQANSQAEINYVAGTRLDFLLGSGTASPGQKLSILQGGNVGIGANNPSELLHLKSTGPARILIEADTDNDDETDNAQIILKQDGGAVVGNLGYKTDTNTIEVRNQYTGVDGHLSLSTSNTERLHIKYNGNVGINTTDPKARLHVASGATSDAPVAGTTNGGLFVSNTNKSYGINMGVHGAGWGWIQSQRADTGTTLYDLNLQPLGGNVGIGTTTTNVDHKLRVGGEIHSTTFVGAVNGLGVDTVSMSSGRGLSLYDGPSLYPQYGMLFAVTTGHMGTHGSVTGGFATYMTMTGSTRGWIWKSITGVNTTSGNVASISSLGALTLNSTATATNFILSSDETLKDNIKEIDVKHTDVNWKNFELKSEPGIKRAGVIAQELEIKHPEFVRTASDGIKSVAYIDLLITKIAELEARLEKAGL